jgi:hypothetical protein
MSMTAQELIKASFRLNGITASGETPTAAEMADGLEAMKIMFDGWSAEGIMVEILTEITHTLVGGSGSYTVGPSGCDITSDWPIEIISGYCRSGGLDYHLEIMSEQRYGQIAVKSTGGTPSRLFYNPTFPNGTITLYHVPSSAMDMVLKAVTMMDKPSSLTTEIVFPGYYDQAIKYNLAVHIAPEYGREASNTVIGLALHSKTIIEARNAMTRTTPVNININSGYRTYNINGDI